VESIADEYVSPLRHILIVKHTVTSHNDLTAINA